MEQGLHSGDCADAQANVKLPFEAGSAPLNRTAFLLLCGSWAFAVVILAVVLRATEVGGAVKPFYAADPVLPLVNDML
ncbi:hypothetical protein Nepgr_033717 [Nepenthes gracilis]|uniref:Uncharacterized protein n=1 Tax=Nepenthes gracilis TaxID=150966 RepID=A0AAD3Y753_NEPGR|nr:hypothetical protein Nepgr_033717 [Nepenthes gracilis]